MNIKGRYQFITEYELPDGNFVPIDMIINFFLNDNHEAYSELESNINTDYLFFDDSSYGILSEMKGFYPMRKCFQNLSIVDNNYKILDTEKMLEYFKYMKEDARELCNNKEKYERDAKINMICD